MKPGTISRDVFPGTPSRHNDSFWVKNEKAQHVHGCVCLFVRVCVCCHDSEMADWQSGKAAPLPLTPQPTPLLGVARDQ